MQKKSIKIELINVSLYLIKYKRTYALQTVVKIIECVKERERDRQRETEKERETEK